MKKIGLILGLLSLFLNGMFGQGANNIRINEVLTINTESVIDEFGRNKPWVELANVAFSSYNIRGMYITTDRRVLDENMSVPDRMKLMSQLPNDGVMKLGVKGHIVLYLNSNPADGSVNLSAKVNEDKPTWIGLYNANAVTLIDSVTVPALGPNMSYARHTDGSAEWDIKPSGAVTPGISNYIKVDETKVERLKREDPHGFGITVLSMGIVFSCLALLFIFFKIFGQLMFRVSKHKTEKEIESETAAPKPVQQTAAAEKQKEDEDVYLAVIAMALSESASGVHDNESNVITIRPKNSNWSNSKH